MDSSDRGQLWRLLRRYGSSTVLRECTLWSIEQSGTGFIGWLNGLGREEALIFEGLERLSCSAAGPDAADEEDENATRAGDRAVPDIPPTPLVPVCRM
ncbi:V1 protein [Persimmon circular DNA virus]|nr:V1 protein [Persimmon circular DNA virus]